jgi:hypothetical protein
MTDERVIYEETFPSVIPYNNKRLTFSVLLKEGDDPQAAFDYAKGVVKQAYQRFSAQSELELLAKPNMGDEAIVPSDYNKGQVPVVDHKHLDEVEEKIMAATTMEQLMLLKHDATTKRLRGVYLNKFNELSKA